MNTDEDIGKTDNFIPGPDRWVSYTVRARSLSRVSRVGRVTVWIRVSGRLRLRFGFSGAKLYRKPVDRRRGKIVGLTEYIIRNSVK